ncbi:MAG: hypothetical protein J5787_04925 [Alphaproteobacteria bacterium]|nr:hypothetical protein [Alphaproteobacteria bacterium]MBO4644063.1 hypothetical protein [Alphaproteobacteria bacterium]
MKLFVLSALLMLTAFNARASEDQSFLLAMDYSVYARLAQNDTFGTVKKALNENPYEKRSDAVAEQKPVQNGEKYTVKDLKSRPRNLIGGGFVNTNDRVAVGAFAGYQYDEINEDKLNEAYSLTINVNIAL